MMSEERRSEDCNDCIKYDNEIKLNNNNNNVVPHNLKPVRNSIPITCHSKTKTVFMKSTLPPLNYEQWSRSKDSEHKQVISLTLMRDNNLQFKKGLISGAIKNCKALNTTEKYPCTLRII